MSGKDDKRARTPVPPPDADEGLDAPDPVRLLAKQANPWRVSLNRTEASTPKELVKGSTTVSLADNLSTFSLDEDTEETPPTAVPGTFTFDLDWEEDEVEETAAETTLDEQVDDLAAALADDAMVPDPADAVDEPDPDPIEEPEVVGEATPTDADDDPDDLPSDIEELAAAMRARRPADPAPMPVPDEDEIDGPDEPSTPRRVSPKRRKAVSTRAATSGMADGSGGDAPPPSAPDKHASDEGGLPLWVAVVLLFGAAYVVFFYLL